MFPTMIIIDIPCGGEQVVIGGGGLDLELLLGDFIRVGFGIRCRFYFGGGLLS